jgi:hypothetical protein
MFHFPGLAPLRVMGHDSHWVSPFGHPRIKACFLLPAAFRRLLRPSSPLCAKASTVCPLQLAVLLFVQFVFDTCVNTLDAFSFCHLFFVFFFFIHVPVYLGNVNCSFSEFNLFCFQRTL